MVHGSCKSQIVVEVEVDGWNVLVWLHAELEQVFALVNDAVLLQVLRHVKHLAHALPGVGGSVHVCIRVTVQNLIKTLLGGNLDGVIMLGQSVEDSNQSRALCQVTDAVTGLVLPPGHREIGIPFRIRLCRWHVQESTMRAHKLCRASLLINVSARLLCRWVKPVCDVRACGENNWVALRSPMILINQKCHVVDLIEERNPNVTRRVVGSDFLWCVIASEFVGAWDVLRLFDTRGSRFSRGWDSSSHHH